MELPGRLAGRAAGREPDLRRSRSTLNDDLRSAPVPALRDDDHQRGEGELLVFYGDFACPFCALAHARLADVGVQRVFRHFALTSKHPRARTLAHAAEAAALQGAFWPFHDSLYGDQGSLEDPHLWQRARDLGLDLDRFEQDRRSDPVAERVASDVRDAVRAGIVTTPTLVIGGRLHPGPPAPGLLDNLRR